MASLVRQNFHVDSEAGVNQQINLELTASYVYLSMAYYFDREDVALPGFHKYFKEQSDEEREHAQKLMKFQNQRGGKIRLTDVRKPTKDEWGTPLEALTEALTLEKKVNESLLKLHEIAARNGDAHMTDFIEEHFLDEQVQSIKQLADHITNIKRVGPGLGEYMFDKNSLS